VLTFLGSRVLGNAWQRQKICFICYCVLNLEPVPIGEEGGPRDAPGGWKRGMLFALAYHPAVIHICIPTWHGFLWIQEEWTVAITCPGGLSSSKNAQIEIHHNLIFSKDIILVTTTLVRIQDCLPNGLNGKCLLYFKYLIPKENALKTSTFVGDQRPSL
jgi:hypothetical protein